MTLSSAWRGHLLATSKNGFSVDRGSSTPVSHFLVLLSLFEPAVSPALIFDLGDYSVVVEAVDAAQGTVKLMK